MGRDNILFLSLVTLPLMRSTRSDNPEHGLGQRIRKLAGAPLLAQISFATLLVCAATVARAFFGKYVDTLSPYATFYLAIEISALMAGSAAGVFATLASSGASSLWFSGASDFSLALFVAGGVIFSLLTDAARHEWSDHSWPRAKEEEPMTPPPSPRPARDCLDTVGETAAALAHEVNQPLAATVTYLKVARRLLEKSGKGAPEVFDVLEKASEQTLRAGRIVTSLRDLVRRRELDKSLVRINDLIDDTIMLPEIVAENANASIEFEKGARHDHALVDREQIRQVIVGLARNALEAMRVAETRRLVISTSNPDNHSIQVDVIDTGCGLAESWADGAFEPFATTKSNSMGVGLSISRSIIERHEGRIWAAPNREGGAVFSFVLPLAESESDA